MVAWKTCPQFLHFLNAPLKRLPHDRAASPLFSDPCFAGLTEHHHIQPARIPTHHTHPSMQQPSAGQEGHSRLGPVKKVWSKWFSLSIQWLARVRVTAESTWAHLSQPLGASIALSSPFFLRRGYFWVITPGEMSELQNPQQFLLTCLCSSLPSVPAFVTARVIHRHGLSRQAAKHHTGACSLHSPVGWERELGEKNPKIHGLR